MNCSKGLIFVYKGTDKQLQCFRMRNYLDSSATEKKSWESSGSQSQHDDFVRKGKRAFINSNTSGKTLNTSLERRYHIPCPVLDTLLQETYHKLTELKL